MSIRLQNSMPAKERLQFYKSAMSFTSAVLLSDEGVRKNSKVGKRHDFSVQWKTRSAENAECGKCGVWKMRSVQNAGCGKCGV